LSRDGVTSQPYYNTAQIDLVISAVRVDMAQAFAEGGECKQGASLPIMMAVATRSLRWRGSANKRPTYGSYCVLGYRCVCVILSL